MIRKICCHGETDITVSVEISHVVRGLGLSQTFSITFVDELSTEISVGHQNYCLTPPLCSEEMLKKHQRSYPVCSHGIA